MTTVVEDGGAVYSASKILPPPTPRAPPNLNDLSLEAAYEAKEKRKYTRFLTSRIRYYEKLLSQRIVPPAKASQILNQCRILSSQLERRPLLDPEGISKHSIFVNGTTLLEPVPFLGVDKDEEHEIHAEIHRIQDEIKDPDNAFRYSYDQADFNLLKLTGVDAGEKSCTPGPLLQLLSVTIFNKTDGTLTNDFEAFGQISVTDHTNSVYNLYKSDSNYPDFVSPGFNYLHIYGCPIAPVMGGSVKFILTNKDTGRTLFNLEYDVTDLIDDEDKLSIKCIGNEGYGVSMVFNKIQFGIIARVRMFLGYTPLNGKPTCKVHGTMNVNSMLCFNTDESDSVEMVDSEYNGFDQFRYVFAVSVTSPQLNAEIELFSGDLKIADGTLKLLATGLSPSHHTLYFPCCKHESYNFGLMLDLYSHDDYFEHFYWEEQNANWSRVCQMPEKPISAVSSSKCSPLVEVFSILVCRGNLSTPPPAICGSVVVRDGNEAVYIFSRNINRPDKLSNKNWHGKSLSLAWPDRWVVEDDFFMHLKLRDSQGIRVCRGYFSWFSGIDRRYGRRMCSVIPGDNGYYAEVHYSVFKNSKKAKVYIKWEGDDDVVVYGSVLAEYINYNDYYPTPYNKKYYQSIIFKRSKEDGMKVNHCSNIPLLKSHVSAPSDCQGLRVYVNLHHPAILGSLKCRKTTGTHVFEANRNAIEQLGLISVKVEWEK